MRTKMLGTALATLVLITSAFGDAIFTPGNINGTNEENVLLNGMGKQQGNLFFKNLASRESKEVR